MNSAPPPDFTHLRALLRGANPPPIHPKTPSDHPSSLPSIPAQILKLTASSPWLQAECETGIGSADGPLYWYLCMRIKAWKWRTREFWCIGERVHVPRFGYWLSTGRSPLREHLILIWIIILILPLNYFPHPIFFSFSLLYQMYTISPYIVNL